MKIDDLANKLKLDSKEVKERAKKLKIDIKKESTEVSEDDAKKITTSFSKKQKDEKKAPVIIRREVILTDDDEHKKEEFDKKKKQDSRKDVGIVQRRNNTEFNIVYRNKPNKPLTVNELFGLNKKIEKTEETNKVEIKTENEATKKNKENEVVEKETEVVKEKVIEATPVEKRNDNNSYKKPEYRPRNNYNNNYSNNNNNNSTTGNRNNYNNNRNYNNNNSYNNNGNNFRRNNDNNFQGNNNFRNRQNNTQNNGYQRTNNYQNKDNEGRNNYQHRNNNNNYQNNGYNNNRNKFNNRPLDDKRIDKKINDIIDTEIVEKDNQRDYSTKTIDKQKLNSRFDETKQKRATRSRKSTEENYDEGKLKGLTRVDRLSNMFGDQEGGMLDYYDLSTERGKRGKKKNIKEERNKQKIFKLTEITIPEEINVKDLSVELKKTSSEVIKVLLKLGIMATINQILDFDTAFLIAQEFGITAIKKEAKKEEDILFDDSEDKEEDLVSRPPVVVVMGHVDHGKTSLLDAVRSTNVIEGEAGGITQHIGAYKVKINNREITFLDTPGHEAFTSMRARGAQITDIAILVVAADDGVMPQTVEAINHAKAAGIPIIVAVNKIDVPGANPEKVKQELMKYDLVPEEWGGDTVFVEISAKKKINIDKLLEMVLLVADMLELKTNPKKQAKGVVIEARLDKTKGPIASVLVQRGSLDIGDTIVVGTSIGRIRDMIDDKGKKIKSAGASTPVKIMGLIKVPEAGDTFYEVKDEKMAKHLIERRERQEREKTMNAYNKVTLGNLFEQMEHENLKQLNIIVKTDVQGTAEALKQSLEKLSDDEVEVKVIHSNTGAITESDVNLARAANAIIIGFNVRPTNTAKDIAEKSKVEIKLYSVIYQAIEDVESAMNGLLDPVYEEKVIGNVEVRQIFKVSNVGTIAGCYVKDGKIERNAGVRIIRNDIVVHEGKLTSLKRFKDDAKEVSKGFECGIQIENYNDLIEGDNIEVFVMEEVKRTIKKNKNIDKSKEANEENK